MDSLNQNLSQSKFDLTGTKIPLKNKNNTNIQYQNLSHSQFNLHGSQIIFKKNSYFSSAKSNVIHSSNVSAPSSSSLKTDDIEAIMKVHEFKEQHKINNPEEYGSKQVNYDECVSCEIDAYPIARKDTSKSSTTKDDGRRTSKKTLSDEEKKEFAMNMEFKDLRVSSIFFMKELLLKTGLLFLFYRRYPVVVF